ncbi:cysteine hydrolase family protein [Candidatus Woesearchaeota archaeon]|nr:cysteine hydrolase family protein [Candidatus Woesearchaeota archaeon]
MKGTIFFDIDTQHNFMRKDGRFYVPGAEKIIPKLKRITDFAGKNNISIVASIDLQKSGVEVMTNYANQANGYRKIPETTLPNAKIIPNNKLENGQLKGILEKYSRYWVFKQKNDIFSNPNTKEMIKNAERACVYGVATDYCVKAAVLGLIKIGVETYVIKDAIKPAFRKNEKKDLELFRKNGARFLTTRQLLSRRLKDT